MDAKKKSLSASERVEPARQAWRKLTASIAPSRWVWVDEFGSNTGLTRRYARSPRGTRAHARAPRNHGTNRTTITSLTLEGLGPGLILEEAMTTRAFESYVRHVLAPTLQPGQIVGLDNLRQHRSDRVRELIEARGASIWFLPTYSPDLNPIEEAFSKVKTLVAAIWAAVAAVTPTDAHGYFAHAGYGRAKRRRARPTGIQRRRVTQGTTFRRTAVGTERALVSCNTLSKGVERWTRPSGRRRFGDSSPRCGTAATTRPPPTCTTRAISARRGRGLRRRSRGSASTTRRSPTCVWTSTSWSWPVTRSC